MTNSLDYIIRHKILALPELASRHGRDVDTLIVYVHYLMAALCIGWGVYFLYALFRFRASKHPRADYKGVTGHASSYVELVVAGVEAVLLLGFAIPLWAKSVDKFPEEKDATVIRVTARQFNWMVRYPGPDGLFGDQDMSIVSATNPLGLLSKDDALKATDLKGKDDISVESGEMAVPVDREVIAYITSMDVIHSFKVLPLRITQDAIPGMRVPVHFLPEVTNTYTINCAQLCGNGHSGMKGFFRVLSAPEYQAWLTKKAGAASVEF